MSLKIIAESDAKIYTDSIRQSFHERNLIGLLSPWPLIALVVSIFYVVIQKIILLLFKPVSILLTLFGGFSNFEEIAPP